MTRKALNNAKAISKLLFCMTGIILFNSASGQVSGDFKIDTVGVYFDTNLDSFLSKIKSEKFVNKRDVSAIPSFIKNELENLTGEFTIANPDSEYRCCCTSSRKLPTRKLVFLAQSKDLLIMTYLTGGIGVSTHILFVKFTGQKIEDMWFANWGENLTSKKAIIRCINQNRSKPGTLHPNFDM